MMVGSTRNANEAPVLAHSSAISSGELSGGVRVTAPTGTLL